MVKKQEPPITFRMDKATREELARLAALSGRNRSNIIRHLICQAIRNPMMVYSLGVIDKPGQS